MAEVSRNQAIHLAQLTKKNLVYIRNARKNNQDVHVVTQLVNSLLGLVVFPRQQYLDEGFLEVSLNEPVLQDWPQWCITLGTTGTLKELIWHIRNAAAHGHLIFSSDSRCLSEVTLTVKDRPLCKPINWRAEINCEDLYAFCLRFVEYIEDKLVKAGQARLDSNLHPH